MIFKAHSGMCVCAVDEFRLVLFMHDDAVWREECEMLAVVCDDRG
jgi:hypothetical protein